MSGGQMSQPNHTSHFDDVSDFLPQTILSADFKKQRLDKFWKEETLMFIHQRIPRVDQPDIDDPQMVAEHAEECCREMLRTEKIFTAQYGFMST